MELMKIEVDARKIINKGINLDTQLQQLENLEKAKGHILVSNKEYHMLRTKLVKLFSKLNNVANTEGKGRDNFTIDILLKAEEIARTISTTQSQAMRRLSERIRKSFQSMRELLRKYSENIEIVDPQLKNNSDLVSCLNEFEVSWESGMNYFLNQKHFVQIMNFSQVIEGTCEKHKKFNDQVECRSEEIFTEIPALLILHSLESDSHDLCANFYPLLLTVGNAIYIKYENLKKTYKTGAMLCDSHFEFYNIIEKIILDIALTESELKKTTVVMDYASSMTMRLKMLALEMSRVSPTDWNNFIEIVLSS